MTRIIVTVLLIAALSLSEEITDEDGGTCSTSPEDKCSDAAEDKEKYEKIKWTDDYDYAIREKLDLADDMISTDKEKAVSMFTEIISEHPDSNRAHYALARTYIAMMNQANKTEERKELCEQAKMNLKTILDKEDNMEMIDKSSANLLLRASETEECSSRDDIIISLRVLRRGEEEGRYGIVLCHELLLAARYQEALEESENILSVKPEEFLVNIIKSTSMKMLGQVKEANRFLRGIDFYEATDSLKKAERETSKYMIINDINYVCSRLYKNGQEDISQIFAKDASKLHLIPSADQRPIYYKEGLKARPVWELTELRSQNRWTNLQSMTGLAQLGDSLNKFKEHFNTILTEASDLMKDLDESWTPVSANKSSYMLPLFLFGKKKHEACSRASTTCKLLKKFKDSSSCPKCISKFLLIKPAAEILPKVGPTNTRLRAVLPLRVTGSAGVRVGEKIVSLETGKVVVFDDSFENRFWNDSNDDIVLLVMDFHHPDLPDREKKSSTFTDYVKNQFMTY